MFFRKAFIFQNWCQLNEVEELYWWSGTMLSLPLHGRDTNSNTFFFHLQHKCKYDANTERTTSQTNTFEKVNLQFVPIYQ